MEKCVENTHNLKRRNFKSQEKNVYKFKNKCKQNEFKKKSLIFTYQIIQILNLKCSILIKEMFAAFYWQELKLAQKFYKGYVFNKFINFAQIIYFPGLLSKEMTEI